MLRCIWMLATLDGLDGQQTKTQLPSCSQTFTRMRHLLEPSVDWPLTWLTTMRGILLPPLHTLKETLFTMRSCIFTPSDPFLPTTAGQTLSSSLTKVGLASSQPGSNSGVTGAMLLALDLVSVLLPTLETHCWIHSSGSSQVASAMVLAIAVHHDLIITALNQMLCSQHLKPVLGSRLISCSFLRTRTRHSCRSIDRGAL